jgi:RNA polymerase sigma-70 factor (ECF subfamily)
VCAQKALDSDRTDELEDYRRELTGYCYRMLGSIFEADDAVQETMVRAWRKLGSFEGRSSVRSWLYRIATNVCLDMLRSRQRRALAMDLGAPGTADSFSGATLPDEAWITPIPHTRMFSVDADPAEVVASKESVRLAFIAALQDLPARQRAVLILSEVLRWHATEVATLLDTTVASVNSALQRARATLAARNANRGSDGGADTSVRALESNDQNALLARYVDAFERYDMSALVSLLREDAQFSMPPFPLWVQGPEDIVAFMTGTGAKCEGSRVIPVTANGGPAAAIYNRSDDGWTPWAIVVLETSGDRIVGLHHFLYPELFADFGLPPRLELE